MHTCSECGIAFAVNANDGRTMHRRTCSQACRQRRYVRRRDNRIKQRIEALLLDGATRQEILTALRD